MQIASKSKLNNCKELITSREHGLAHNLFTADRRRAKRGMFSRQYDGGCTEHGTYRFSVRPVSRVQN